MKTVKREFHGDSITLDFHEYIDCTFVNCVIVFFGYAEPVLLNCNFQECQFQLRGPAALSFSWVSGMRRHESPANQAIANSILLAAGLPL